MYELFRSDDFRFVMADGEFEEAVGFTIEGQGRVAIWSDETDATVDPPTRMRLVWTFND